MSVKRKILLTGAAGRIGTAYRKHASNVYEFRLLDVRPVEDAGPFESHVVDIADPDATRAACEGIDTVIHLAADPRTSAEFYTDLLEPNFKGTYNMYRAAKDAGCRRLIFASSVNAVGGYRHTRQVRTSDAPCPGNVYGASKAFGESLGAYFGSVEGLSNISIRIGAVGEQQHIHADADHFFRAIFVSMRDLCHLLDRCVETEGITFAVVNGISNNKTNWLDLTETSQLLDYHPVDDAFAV